MRPSEAHGANRNASLLQAVGKIKYPASLLLPEGQYLVAHSLHGTAGQHTGDFPRGGKEAVLPSGQKHIVKSAGIFLSGGKLFNNSIPRILVRLSVFLPKGADNAVGQNPGMPHFFGKRALCNTAPGRSPRAVARKRQQPVRDSRTLCADKCQLVVFII